ncbi:MAG: DUF116 domain-containing protein [Methanospirillum sp.]
MVGEADGEVPEVITYSLRSGAPDSAAYYRDAARFADEVVAAGAPLLPVVAEFARSVAENGKASVRSDEEYLLELLMLGVHWRAYGDDAHDLACTPRCVLASLAEIRRASPFLKPAADRLRGILSTIYLVPKGRDWHPLPTLDHLDRLLGWLRAAGDYREEVERLSAWRDYLHSLSEDEAVAVLAAAIVFAEWFEAASIAALGVYTAGVDRFLAEEHPSYAWREDVVFAARPRVEYHLNMVGAELMNRAQRAAFLEAPRKAVIVPACLRYHPRPRCKAVAGPLACECRGCEPRCRVRQLTRLGAEHGFDVLLVPHESAVFAGEAGRQLLGDGAGIVGITCVPNLLAGGWKALRLGLPPQCVLLDHCGCRKHWHDEGIVTGIDEAEFRRVLDLGEPAGGAAPIG